MVNQNLFMLTANLFIVVLSPSLSHALLSRTRPLIVNSYIYLFGLLYARPLHYFAISEVEAFV